MPMYGVVCSVCTIKGHVHIHIVTHRSSIVYVCVQAINVLVGSLFQPQSLDSKWQEWN